MNYAEVREVVRIGRAGAEGIDTAASDPAQGRMPLAPRRKGALLEA